MKEKNNLMKANNFQFQNTAPHHPPILSEKVNPRSQARFAPDACRKHGMGTVQQIRQPRNDRKPESRNPKPSRML